MKYPPTSSSARITEIFSSLQGEGPHAGERHLFLRFEECNIHCEYCDELHKIGAWKTLEDVFNEINSLEKNEGPHSFISLTGGEPLLYLEFLKSLLPALKMKGHKIYLETNGILTPALAEILDYCDVISMDMKPGSVTQETSFENAHRSFLEVAKKKETHIKMVLSKEIDFEEFFRLVKIIQETAPETLLVLQPLSSEIEGHQDSELMGILEALQRQSLKLIPHVRIIPRYHKILQIR